MSGNINSQNLNVNKHSLKDMFMKIFEYKEQDNHEFNLKLGPNDKKETFEIKVDQTQDNTNKSQIKKTINTTDVNNVFPSLDVNLEYMKTKYNIEINSDIMIREFILNARNKQYSAFILYIDGMVNSQIINDFVLEPLMMKNRANTFDGMEDRVLSEAVTNNITVRKVKRFDLVDYIYESLMPQNSVEKEQGFKELLSGVNSGGCALFVDTIQVGFNIDVKGFEKRSINPPNNEVVIRGANEAFVESIRTNTSMLRRIINNEDLIIENFNVGKITSTSIGVCYMKSIANENLIKEVKYRIENLDVDYLISSGQLEQLIQDNTNSLFPQMLETERPDKAATFLLEGRIIIIVNGSPFVLTAPGTLNDFMSSPEDFNLKFQFANLLKVIRFLAAILALLLPGFYVAITNYHHELIPTELLFTIVASKEFVPFPSIFEILIMEVSFELIREAGLRVPNAIGPTIGIVGALILGDAAVSASIVSPILIIIVAITGICSFAIPDFSLNFTVRISRFLYIILGYIGGFLGIGFFLFIQLTLVCNLKSFGIEYIQGYMNNSSVRTISSYFMHPIWKREKTSKFLKAKKEYTQGKISMGWKNKKKQNNSDNNDN